MAGVSALLSAILTELGRSLSYLWVLLRSLLGPLFHLLLAVTPVPLAVFVATVWTVVLAVGLLVLASAINHLGRADAYATLSRTLFGTERDPDRVPIRPADVDTDEVTDERGQFSPSAFESVTGLTPPEFIHLFVKGKGGTVRQSTLVRSFPWSRSTVTRYIDPLESRELLVRVKVGRENVVCTPDAVPDGHEPE